MPSSWTWYANSASNTVTPTASVTASNWWLSDITSSATTTSSTWAGDAQLILAAMQRHAIQALQNQTYSQEMALQEEAFFARGEPPPPPPVMREEYAPEARRRARQLLMSLLDKAQRASYRRRRWFHLQGRSGIMYRIHHGRVANIEVPSRGHRLCVHPIGSMPVEDVLAAQVLHLRADDVALARVANVHAGLGGPRG